MIWSKLMQCLRYGDSGNYFSAWLCDCPLFYCTMHMHTRHSVIYAPPPASVICQSHASVVSKQLSSLSWFSALKKALPKILVLSCQTLSYVFFLLFFATALRLSQVFFILVWSLQVYHTHTCLTALFPGLPRWVGTRKAKPIWILLKQETVSGSGISWNICRSAPRSRQITTPTPHHSVFYRPDALPVAQPTASKHWRHKFIIVSAHIC